MNGEAHCWRSSDGIIEARTVEGVQKDATQGRKPEKPRKDRLFTNFDWGYLIPNSNHQNQFKEQHQCYATPACHISNVIESTLFLLESTQIL